MIGPDERVRVEARIATLREELGRGTRRLEEIDAEAARIRETVLRIAGALQVLGELLEPVGGEDFGPENAR